MKMIRIVFFCCCCFVFWWIAKAQSAFSPIECKMCKMDYTASSFVRVNINNNNNVDKWQMNEKYTFNSCSPSQSTWLISMYPGIVSVKWSPLLGQKWKTREWLCALLVGAKRRLRLRVNSFLLRWTLIIHRLNSNQVHPHPTDHSSHIASFFFLFFSWLSNKPMMIIALSHWQIK
jgi:hypothetical protein